MKNRSECVRRTCEGGEGCDGYGEEADGQVRERHVADEDVRAAPHLPLPVVPHMSDGSAGFLGSLFC